MLSASGVRILPETQMNVKHIQMILFKMLCPSPQIENKYKCHVLFARNIIQSFLLLSKKAKETHTSICKMLQIGIIQYHAQ